MMQFICSIILLEYIFTKYLYFKISFKQKQTKNPFLYISMACARNDVSSVKRPLPDQAAFKLQPLPKEIWLKIVTAWNTFMNKYDFKNKNDFSNFREQIKNILFGICCEHPSLNSGIYDFSTTPKFIVNLISEVSRDNYFYRHPHDPLNTHKYKLLEAKKIRADIARANVEAQNQYEFEKLYASRFLQPGVFSSRVRKLNLNNRLNFNDQNIYILPIKN